MEDALTKALEFANFPATLNTQKKILKNKYNDNCALYQRRQIYSVRDFVFVRLSHNVESTVIVDDNDTPIEIDNVQEFFDLVKNKYATASNIYLSEYKKLTSQRSIEGLVDE